MSREMKYSFILKNVDIYNFLWYNKNTTKKGDKKVRYAIAVSLVENDGNVVDGIFAYGKYGLATALCKKKENYEKNEYRTKIFTNVLDAKQEVKNLSKAYRREFHKRAKKYNLDISKFRFFILKVDTPKFKYEIGEECKTSNTKKPYKVYYIF